MTLELFYDGRTGPWGLPCRFTAFSKGEPFSLKRSPSCAASLEDLLQTLGLADQREDPVATLVAQKVIELAQTGMRDPIRLKQLTLEAFGLAN